MMVKTCSLNMRSVAALLKEPSLDSSHQGGETATPVTYIQLTVPGTTSGARSTAAAAEPFRVGVLACALAQRLTRSLLMLHVRPPQRAGTPLTRARLAARRLDGGYDPIDIRRSGAEGNLISQQLPVRGTLAQSLVDFAVLRST